MLHCSNSSLLFIKIANLFRNYLYTIKQKKFEKEKEITEGNCILCAVDIDFIRLPEYNIICAFVSLIWEGRIMEFLSTTQMAEKWKISSRRIQILCNEGRIDGAMKVGQTWVIPADAEKPDDQRIKNGKYIKTKRGTVL